MVRINKTNVELNALQNDKTKSAGKNQQEMGTIQIVPEQEKDLDMGLSVQKNSAEEVPDDPPKTDEQTKKDFIERQEKQERRAKREKTVVGRWINNRQDDYASVKEKDGFGAKALETGKVTLRGMRKGFNNQNIPFFRSDVFTHRNISIKLSFVIYNSR